MTTYSDTIYPAATSETHILRKQIHVAVMVAAFAVLNESTATPLHDERVSWARRALANPARMTDRMIVQILSNSGIQAAPATSTDTAVQNVVNGLINSFLQER